MSWIFPSAPLAIRRGLVDWHCVGERLLPDELGRTIPMLIFLFEVSRARRAMGRNQKVVYLEPITVASLPQGASQMAVIRNSDQLFRFAFGPLQG
jgi:hypothetical protein